MASAPKPTPQTFRAATVTEALQQVQEALGPEAMVISVRQAPPSQGWQVWREPEVEVLAIGNPQAGELGADEKPAGSGGRDAHEPEPPVRLPAQEIYAAVEQQAAPGNRAAHKNQTAQWTGPVDPPAVKRRASGSVEVVPGLPLAGRAGKGQGAVPVEETAPLAPGLPRPPIVDRLLAQGLDPELVQKMLSIYAETLGATALRDEVRLEAHLSQQCRAVIRTRSAGQAAAERVVCVTGSSGSGKTNLCAKLAAQAWKKGRRVSWICADTVSAGAIQQAQMYTGVMGLPLHTVYTPEELSACVAAAGEADLVLVDTPGCNPYRETSLAQIGDLVTSLPDRSIYLALAANNKESDLAQTVAAFRPFNPAGLILTRLDETASFGGLVNLAWRSRLPVLYFSAGPRVPNDLSPARAEALVAAVFHERWMV